MKIKAMTTVAVLLPTALLMLSLSMPADAQLYRWVDDAGKVHYTDSLPPERAPSERRVFSSRGNTVEDIKAAPTREQLQELQEARQAARQASQEQEQERQRQLEYDRMLTMTYLNVGQIENTREERLARLKSQEQTSLARQQRYEREIHRLEQQAARAERSGAETKTIYERLLHTRGRLADEQSFMQGLKRQGDEIRDEFNAYIARFEELQDAQYNR